MIRLHGFRQRPLLTPRRSKRDAAPKAPLIEWLKVVAMPIATLLITIIGGKIVSDVVKDREARESNERLYAQLLSQREQSDALIRKDMFSVVINRFLAESNQQDWNDKILQIELLANNFNQSLDLTPLFKDIALRLPSAKGLEEKDTTRLLNRLNRTASNLVIKQLSSLSRRGHLKQGSIQALAWEKSKKADNKVIEGSLLRSRLVPSISGSNALGADSIHYLVEILDVNRAHREVEIRLLVQFDDQTSQELDTHFWVSRYDFPMLDNSQLPYGLRAAVVITDYDIVDEGQPTEEHFVGLSLVIFPAASASFKERQDYDDILLDMLRSQQGGTRNRELVPPSGASMPASGVTK
jgi:hypothetical protein